MKLENLKIAVIGLGYVGLPLAVEFGKKRNTIGFDINKKRIKELKNKSDSTLEVSNKDLKNSLKLKLTSNEKKLMSANCYIITVPTPIDKYNRPNLKPLLDASKTVAKFLKSDDRIENLKIKFEDYIKKNKNLKWKVSKDIFDRENTFLIIHLNQNITIKTMQRVLLDINFDSLPNNFVLLKSDYLKMQLNKTIDITN